MELHNMPIVRRPFGIILFYEKLTGTRPHHTTLTGIVMLLHAATCGYVGLVCGQPDADAQLSDGIV
jgi:hypothetical protein